MIRRFGTWLDETAKESNGVGVSALLTAIDGIVSAFTYIGVGTVGLCVVSSIIHKDKEDSAD